MTRNNRHKLNLRLGTTDYERLIQMAEELSAESHQYVSLNRVILLLIRGEITQTTPTYSYHRIVAPPS